MPEGSLRPCRGGVCRLGLLPLPTPLLLRPPPLPPALLLLLLPLLLAGRPAMASTPMLLLLLQAAAPAVARARDGAPLPSRANPLSPLVLLVTPAAAAMPPLTDSKAQGRARACGAAAVFRGGGGSMPPLLLLLLLLLLLRARGRHHRGRVSSVEMVLCVP
jgi:hypothetical protein